MKRKIPLLFLCLLFLGIAMYAGISLWKQWQEYKTGEETYNSLSQYIQVEEPPLMAAGPPGQTSETSEQVKETLPIETELTNDTFWPVVDFESLQAINPDVVAWIYLEGTVINYPVVLGHDNSEYLYKLVDGTTNSAGSIFMDYRNQPEFSDRNTILYGHHMKDKTMFAPITNYKDQAFYEEHPACLILTPEGNFKLEFFAGFVADLNGDAWKLEFAPNGEFGSWLEKAMANSTFESMIIPTPEDRVVTLSTCSYEYDDARYVLMGIMVPQKERG